MITPINDYLYRIKVFKINKHLKIKDLDVGPLISKMLIPKEYLGFLLKATLFNIARRRSNTPILKEQRSRAK